MALPAGPFTLAERRLPWRPRTIRTRLAGLGPVRTLAGVMLIGPKLIGRK